MEPENIKTKYHQLGVPQELIFQNYTYKFKKELINSILSYRCMHRKCNASLKISIENAKKIYSKKDEELSSIQFTLVGEHSNHPSENKIEDKSNSIKTEKELLDLAKKLIKNKLKQPLSFHIQNLDNNKINISRNKIKNILQSLREEYFPKDVDFLEHIELIKIDLGDSEETKNLIYCPGKESFINPKNNKSENIVFFSTLFQLKLISKCNELFIDGTFKMAPKKYYQILNFWGLLPIKKIYVPLLHVLMTSKCTIAYSHVFNLLIQCLSDINIECDFSSKIITTDYEKSLRNSINNTLKPKLLKGCYFHYSKALWKKCRDFGLTAKKYRKDSMIFIFCLKIFPFIHNEYRSIYIEKLEKFCKRQR